MLINATSGTPGMILTCTRRFQALVSCRKARPAPIMAMATPTAAPITATRIITTAIVTGRSSILFGEDIIGDRRGCLVAARKSEDRPGVLRNEVVEPGRKTDGTASGPDWA